MELAKAIRRLFGVEREGGGITQETPPQDPTKGVDDEDALPENYLQDRKAVRQKRLLVEQRIDRRRRQQDPYSTLRASSRFQIGNDGETAVTTPAVGRVLKKRYIDLCQEVRVPQRHLVMAVLTSTLDSYEGMLKARLPYCKTKKDVQDVVKGCFGTPLVRLA